MPTLIYLSPLSHDGKMLLKFPNRFLSFLSLIFSRGLLHLSRNIAHPPTPGSNTVLASVCLVLTMIIRCDQRWPKQALLPPAIQGLYDWHEEEEEDTD